MPMQMQDARCKMRKNQGARTHRTNGRFNFSSASNLEIMMFWGEKTRASGRAFLGGRGSLYIVTEAWAGARGPSGNSWRSWHFLALAG